MNAEPAARQKLDHACLAKGAQATTAIEGAAITAPDLRAIPEADPRRYGG